MATNAEIRAALDDGGPIISLDAADVRRLLTTSEVVRIAAEHWASRPDDDEPMVRQQRADGQWLLVQLNYIDGVR